MVQAIKGEDRRRLQKWFVSCAKGKVDRGLEPEVFTVLSEVLTTFE